VAIVLLLASTPAGLAQKKKAICLPPLLHRIPGRVISMSGCVDILLFLERTFILLFKPLAVVRTGKFRENTSFFG
jgi:hypothetical protein